MHATRIVAILGLVPFQLFAPNSLPGHPTANRRVPATGGQFAVRTRLFGPNLSVPAAGGQNCCVRTSPDQSRSNPEALLGVDASSAGLERDQVGTALALLSPAALPAQQRQQAPQQKPKEKEKLALAQIVERLPRRVTSKASTPGDMVNFLLIGTRKQVEDSLTAAGWVQVDRTPEDAITHAIQEITEHKAYSEMPMSELYLFGRSQDYGWAEGIPIHIVTERNHFRLWESPWLTADGQTVWVGAGTHDIDIEQDTLGNLSHKIDPDVDLERDYIAGSLADASKVRERSYLSPANPVQQALTATGAPFHSDGRILVICLK